VVLVFHLKILLKQEILIYLDYKILQEYIIFCILYKMDHKLMRLDKNKFLML